MNSKELALKIKDLLEDKLAENIVCFDICEYSTIADYLIIGTGNVDIHVKSISENMSVELKKLGETPISHEGIDSGTWVCMDYGDIIVHIMRSKEREFYNLESIWGRCPKV